MSSLPPTKRRTFRLSKSVLDQLEGISKILLILGTLAGAVWALFEYSAKQDKERVTHTLSYVERFNKDTLLDARTRIGSTWYALRDFVARADTGEGDDAYKQRMRQLVFEVVNKAPVQLPDGSAVTGLVGDLDQVQGFFGELQICIDARICDQATADAYFADYAQRFYCLHEPFIAFKQHEYDLTYGVKLKAFIDQASNIDARSKKCVAGP